METHMEKKDICLVDSATTHTILKNRNFFSNIVFDTHKVSTIAGPAHIIEGYGKANLMLPNGTQIYVQNTLY